MHSRHVLFIFVSLLCSLTLAVPIQKDDGSVKGKGKGRAKSALPGWVVPAQPVHTSAVSVIMSSLSNAFNFRAQPSKWSDVFESWALEDPIFLSVRIASAAEPGISTVRSSILEYADGLRKNGREHPLEDHKYMDVTSITLSPA